MNNINTNSNIFSLCFFFLQYVTDDTDDILCVCWFIRSLFMKYLVRSWSWRCLIKTLTKMTFSEGISMGYCQLV